MTLGLGQGGRFLPCPASALRGNAYSTDLKLAAQSMTSLQLLVNLESTTRITV